MALDHGRRLTSSVAVLVLGLSLASCAAGDQPAPVEIVEVSQVIQEYRDAAENFPEPLPPGDEFPSDPPGDYSADEHYEKGYGESYAAMFWRCEWIGEYLDAFDSDDESRQVTALDELEKWRTIPWVSAHVVDDPEDPYVTTSIDPARLGDPTALKQFYESC
ncbi:MAG: hypothetical protein JWP32_1326 [Schumannella sp.]|nr:hypothetical protein [Schumannella sp.]